MIVALLLAALTIDEAVDRGLRNNATVSVARATLTVTAAETAASRSFPSPEFRMSTGSYDADPETVKERTTVGLRYSPPRPRELSLRHAIAKAREDAARSEIRVVEARAANAVRHAFRRAVITQNRASLAERTLNLQKARRRTVLRQVSAGLKQSDESDLAELDVEDADNAVRRAVSLARLEKRKLASLIGEPESFVDELVSDPELQSVPASLSPNFLVTEAALSHRAELTTIESACREYSAQEKLAKHQQYPWISFVEVSHRVTYLPDRGPWGWKFGIDLPFFRSAAAADARIAAARESRCRVQQNALSRTIRTEVEEAAMALDALRRELVDMERLRSGPAARASQRIQTALKAGHADQIDVFDSQVRLLTIEDRWLERRLQYVELESQLETALGTSLSSTNQTN